MISNAREIHVNGDTYYWARSKEPGGVVLDLGDKGKHLVNVEYADPDQWCFCGDPHCDNAPPVRTPRLASILARIILADDLTLEPGVVVDHNWKVTSVVACS